MFGGHLEEAKNLAWFSVLIVYGASRHGPAGLPIRLNDAALSHAGDGIGLPLLEVRPIRNHELATLQ